MSLLIRNFTKTKVRPRALEAVAASVLQSEKIKREAEISLVFVGEKRMRQLNKLYRGVDRVTDVLSFEGESSGGDGFIDPEDGVAYLGEIFICSERAKRQAKEKGHALKKEIDILLVHGLFHLLGYDHITDQDYAIMQPKENKIIKNLYR